MVKLPTFKGYTFDFRLKEIRLADPDKAIEFISMDSPKGEQLCDELFELEEGTQEFHRYLDEAQKAGYDLDSVLK